VKNTYKYLPYQYDFSKSEVFFSEDSKSEKIVGYQYPYIRYFLNDSSIRDLFGAEVGPKLVDLIEIALAVYLADRVSPRDPRKHSKQNWVRTIRLKIGVRCPEFWQQYEIQNDLNILLNFLTDDDWQLDFVKLEGHDRLFESQRSLRLPPDTSPRVALFSGGLDSLAGVATCMLSDTDSHFVLVSGATNYQQISRQRKQVEQLRNVERSGDFTHLLVDFGIKWHESNYAKQETTQRTRGFLFSALGCMAAVNAGSNVLEIYENGIGAINLPFDSSQISAMNSRSVHPVTLRYLGNLFSKVVEYEFEVQNKFLFSTKAEMCLSLNSEISGLIPITFSCDGFPVHVAGKPQCGVCSSCLLRRLSLQSAGLGRFDDGNNYGMDLSSSNANPSPAQLNHLKAMEWHFEELRRCLNYSNPWKALCTTFPELLTVVAFLSELNGADLKATEIAVCRLLRTHCDEWSRFSLRQHIVDCAQIAA
jgi:7-cyano-7-deazaguanine synthase in queuosine biosynthesis